MFLDLDIFEVPNYWLLTLWYILPIFTHDGHMVYTWCTYGLHVMYTCAIQNDTLTIWCTHGFQMLYILILGTWNVHIGNIIRGHYDFYDW